MQPHIPLLLGCLLLTGGSADAGDDLTKVLQTIARADNYTFTVKEGTANSVVEAKFHKGQPLYCKADRIEFYRKANVLVYKQGNEWQRSRTGTLSDPLLVLGASAKVRALRLPHEDLSILSRALRGVKKTETSVTGEFAADAARQLARTEDRDVARGGTARLWFDAAGRISKYEIAIRVQGRRGNAEVNGTMTRTVTIAEVGTTRVELPPAAKKALE